MAKNLPKMKKKRKKKRKREQKRCLKAEIKIAHICGAFIMIRAHYVLKYVYLDLEKKGSNFQIRSLLI